MQAFTWKRAYDIGQNRKRISRDKNHSYKQIFIIYIFDYLLLVFYFQSICMKLILSIPCYCSEG